MSITPLVDVIIPTYKRDYLTFRSVESVLSQSFTKLQLFVIEDGSDTYYQYLQRHALHDRRLHYVKLLVNHGVSYTRNLGAHIGASKYITFLDSDDIWHIDKLNKQIQYLESNDDIYWAHCNEIWFKNNKKIQQKAMHCKQGGQFIERLLTRCLISPSSVIFRREFWEQKVRGFLDSFHVAEDYEMWLRLNFNFPIGYLDEPLVIKFSGAWEQLSQTLEIDRQRVLALHRFKRLYSGHPSFHIIYPSWKKNILEKISILQKGSLKHNQLIRYRQYKQWERVIQRNN